ncbi:protein-L-isoaspartate O-methyltransferase family protein [Phytoactinopolyspora mesophila]|uniref:Protein-L-isoaspartate O-methyltransferase n=1 Tax=Phytoactinopolyspora mesophila TaxID=2650750 RepID=A0A7K3MA88_9ACTN|nr:methyltransferase domain-containing protein [Phytoactinopolyspora mesophila]NDL60225.1 methyltransferase domain-containing protein [Phytoactinopolyspora mesophila]
MPIYSPTLAEALTLVHEDTYVRREGGDLVAQSSSQQIIADLIDRLDLEAGMRVLEIGTGSGYSTALLAHLAEDTGWVVSIDVVADLVERAGRLLAADGYSNTTILRADGAQGAPEHGPFDRIIVWTTAPHLPTTWTTQVAPDGVIVSPIALAPVSKSGVGTRTRLKGGATPYVDQLFPAGFVEMHGQELDQWLLPPYGVDVVSRDDSGRPCWLSGPWLRSPEHYVQGQRLLQSLITNRESTAGPLGSEESATDFRAWLLATRPGGLTTAALGEPLWQLGYAHSGGAALTDVRSATQTVTNGDTEAAAVLAGWADTWRQLGSPGLADLRTQLIPFYDGWTLEATLDRHASNQGSST